eukprot:scaffold658939_cov51-Prasinocladus_malaysianus.AAC.1
MPAAAWRTSWPTWMRTLRRSAQKPTGPRCVSSPARIFNRHIGRSREQGLVSSNNNLAHCMI